MITGVHYLLYSADAEADRAFLRDVLGLPYVDAHDGWLIFALPPAEMGVHPADTDWTYDLFFMCDDLTGTMAELEERGAEFDGEVSDDPGVGRFARIRLPSGGYVGLYEPTHATPLAGYSTSTAPQRSSATTIPPD